MKIALVAMSGLRVQNRRLQDLGLTLPGFIERKKVIASLPSLGLLTLAGLTPNEFEVKYFEISDYKNKGINLHSFDIIAISSFTAQIYEAYQLADEYRALGKTVVIGGLHATACPNEAAQHADSIFIGEAEVTWGKFLTDYKNGKIKSFYHGDEKDNVLKQTVIPKYELLDIEKYNRITVQTQRGCPFKCEFCASSIRLTPYYRQKPVESILNEIDHIKSIWAQPFIEFADDNSFVNKLHSKQLLRGLGPKKIKWFTETDISVAEDDELLDLLAESGCRQLLIGFESPSSKQVTGIELKSDWKYRQAEKYINAIEKIQRKGISVNGCFVLGLDTHTTDIFDEIEEFVNSSGLSDVQITLQTPFPNTELYHRLNAEGRLIKQTFWDKCTLFDVTYIPKNMSISELESGFEKLMKNLYTDDKVAKRRQLFLKNYRS